MFGLPKVKFEIANVAREMGKLMDQLVATNAELACVKDDLFATKAQLSAALERIQQLESRSERPRTHFSK